MTGGDDEEASSTANEGVVRAGMVSHNQKSDRRGRRRFRPEKNIIAIHDSSSKQYNKKCNECHTEIHTGRAWIRRYPPHIRPWSPLRRKARRRPPVPVVPPHG